MSLTNWHEDAAVNGWNMPLVPRWWRWWGVRHVRVLWSARKVRQHNAFYRGLGMIPNGYDRWVLFGMWHGMDGNKPAGGGE